MVDNDDDDDDEKELTNLSVAGPQLSRAVHLCLAMSFEMIL